MYYLSSYFTQLKISHIAKKKIDYRNILSINIFVASAAAVNGKQIDAPKVHDATSVLFCSLWWE